jgi:4-amino-4-deoxy-L-arabinose transferase-like glycosyltransferase
VAEREWREASDMRRSTLTLVVVLVVAAALRFWALGAGIPSTLGVDEPQIMNRSVRMMKAGTLNPEGFFDYPGLYLYLQAGVATLRFLAGAMAGEWRSLNDAGTEEFYLWGRAVTATLGTLTVLVVYRIGMRWGARHALLSAALLTVMPLHVRESHYVLTDIPTTFFVSVAFLLTLAAHEQPTAAAFAKAGAAAGLAAATKYPGALVGILPLIAVWMTPATRPSRVTAALATILGAAATFLIAAPYTILDLPGFLNAYAALAYGYALGAPPEPGWLLYLKHLRTSFLWPAMLLLVAGVVLATVRAVRGPGRVRWTLAIVFPVVYIYSLSNQSLVFARYLLPVIPFLCLLIAAAVVSGVSLLRRFDIPRTVRTALIAGLTVAVLLPPAIQAVGFNRLISRPSTLDLAYSWIVENVPRGSTVVVETGRIHLPVHYKSSSMRQLRERDFATYRDAGVDYLIASSEAYGKYLSSPQNHPREYAEYMQLFGQMKELKRFPSTNGQPGPEILVLQLKR